ncbi:Hypothetical predicted protein [Lecanosticta acicola]|uniref:Uncharacterized protein n=1 Tax=Lecanosticta acicola TaxID=111012 RepID=A0AAI8YS08_9PEZI|nr:Hypothetical predicted protein [Lecanosticta acicola]
MRPRAQSYGPLDGLPGDRNAVAWYWRVLAFVSWFMILGGFLMLPATFEKAHDPSELRISQAAVGIFAVALLAAGFSFTGLLCFAVRNTLFQAEAIFLPALTSSFIGLLTVFYAFLVYTRYTFHTPALLTTIAAAIATVVYAGLLFWSYRKGGTATRPRQQMPVPMTSQPYRGAQSEHRDSEATLWQDQSYYENYTRNMFPSAHNPNQPPPTGYGFDPHQITEDEMQRQQMLMLLLQREEQSTPDPSVGASTFRIDWQGRDEEDGPPPQGYYAPQSQSEGPRAGHPDPTPGIMRQFTNELELRPWDGVWRAPARVRTSLWARPGGREVREARRREIERG